MSAGRPSSRIRTWIFFDALIYQTSVRLTPHDTSAAVFIDIDPADTSAPTGRRLFLHGAAEHLVGAPPVAAEETRPPPTGPRRRSHGGPLSWGLTAGTWEDIAFGLGYRPSPTVATPGQVELRDLAVVHDVLQWMFTSLAANDYCRGLAGWMAGCARVTSIVPMDGYEVLTASPLYVERVAPPEADQ